MTTSTPLISSQRIVATCMTIAFGSIPATFIAVLPAMALGMSFMGLFSTRQDSDFAALLFFMFWGFAGIYGTVALWLTPFFQRSAFVKAGLVFGLLAIAPATIALLVNMDAAGVLGLKLNWESVVVVGYLTVPVVAISWLYYFARTKRESYF